MLLCIAKGVTVLGVAGVVFSTTFGLEYHVQMRIQIGHIGGCVIMLVGLGDSDLPLLVRTIRAVALVD